MPRSRSRTRRALSPIASPLCAAGTHWLMIMHQSALRQRLVDRTGRIRAGALRAPARRRTAARNRRRPAAAARAGADRSRRRTPAACRRSPSPAADRPRRAGPRRSRSCSAAIGQDRVHQRRHVHRILVVEQHAGAVHRRRHRRRRVGEHRHLLVERLDERHAEAFVLARAQEQIGDLVEGDQLLVRDVADEVHVRSAERRRPAGAATPDSARIRSGRRRSAAASAG